MTPIQHPCQTCALDPTTCPHMDTCPELEAWETQAYDKYDEAMEED